MVLAFALLTPSSLLAAPPASTATPEPGPETSSEVDDKPAPAELPDEASVRAALAEGDLTTARELAVARSEAEPTADNLVLEAQVWRALGDYEHAKRAYAAARDALPEDAGDEREAITAELEALEQLSRGTKADEPASEHRERIDRERAERLAALAPKPPPPEVIDEPAPEPIIKKWYFWVTLGAVVASAGAIVGLAASSAVQDSKANNDAAAARRPIPLGGVMLRF